MSVLSKIHPVKCWDFANRTRFPVRFPRFTVVFPDFQRNNTQAGDYPFFEFTNYFFIQHFLCFLPLPHGQRSFLPILGSVRTMVVWSCVCVSSSKTHSYLGGGVERLSRTPNSISTSSTSPRTPQSTQSCLYASRIVSRELVALRFTR